MHPVLSAAAFLLLAVLARSEPSGQSYGPFSNGLDQDGGLQPAVGGYELHYVTC